MIVVTYDTMKILHALYININLQPMTARRLETYVCKSNTQSQSIGCNCHICHVGSTTHMQSSSQDILVQVLAGRCRHSLLMTSCWRLPGGATHYTQTSSKDVLHQGHPRGEVLPFRDMSFLIYRKHSLLEATPEGLPRGSKPTRSSPLQSKMHKRPSL